MQLRTSVIGKHTLEAAKNARLDWTGGVHLRMMKSALFRPLQRNHTQLDFAIDLKAE